MCAGMGADAIRGRRREVSRVKNPGRRVVRISTAKESEATDGE